MNKKKVIKIVGIIMVIVMVVLLFMFRVTINNSIQSAKIKFVVKSRYQKPDYQIEFINNIEVHTDGNGYRRYYDMLLIFENENKIVYSNEATKNKKISFVLSYPYYLKTKVINLENSILENIQKYVTNKFLLTPKKEFNLKEEVGDIVIDNIKYDNENNIQDIKRYFIPKENNTELYNILEQVKK